MILKIENPNTRAWVYFGDIERISVLRQGAVSFVLNDLQDNAPRHLRLRPNYNPELGLHSPDFMFLEEDQLVKSLVDGEKAPPSNKDLASAPAKVARLVRGKGPSLEVAWLASNAFLLNDEGKTIERL